jgi:hypothetical protein
MTSPTSERDRLPVDPHTGQPLPPRSQPGYYPGFSTLSQSSFWDEATRAVVLERTDHVPPMRFFSQEEVPLFNAVIDRILPQDDRDEQHRVPVANYIDFRLYSGQSDGYRFEDMPSDGEAHHLGLQGIEAVAQHMHGQRFVDLGPRQQDEVLQSLHDATPQGGEDIWERLPVARYWLLLVQDAIDAYYSHPYAWDEVGFGGPAYPRGYFRLEGGLPEPWEVNERRYDWAAPPESLSDVYRSVGGPSKHRAPAGQEGTH